MRADPFAQCDFHTISIKYDKIYFVYLVEQGAISSDPEIAVELLRDPGGSAVMRDGTNSSVIQQLRETVRRHDVDGLASVSLAIVAPHTHWAPAAIIETFDPKSQRYWIGPNQPYGSAWPISFVFTPSGALPYEWAAESVPLSVADLSSAYAKIRNVADELAHDPKVRLPIAAGLSINHRFKNIAAPPLYSTMETPDEASGLSCVTPDFTSDKTSNEFAGQVGWTIVAGRKLLAQEQSAVTYLEGQLMTVPFEVASEIFTALLLVGQEAAAGATARALNAR